MRSYGFIAHELQLVLPCCVDGEKDATTEVVDEDGTTSSQPVHQTVAYTETLVPILVSAIRELEARVAALEARPAVG